LRRLGAATRQCAHTKPAVIAQDRAPPRLVAPSATASSGPAGAVPAVTAAVTASISRFNYLTLKADCPRQAAGGALRLVRRVRSGRTRRQRAAVRSPRIPPDSTAPQRHIALGAHATLKFRNRQLSRSQLAIVHEPHNGRDAASSRGPRCRRRCGAIHPTRADRLPSFYPNLFSQHITCRY
jgi:hypothetical protein